MKKTILAAIIGATALGVDAGDWGKASVDTNKTPIEECYDLGGEISAGYMTDFFLNGSRLARDTIWADVNYSFESIVPVTIGAAYYSFPRKEGHGVAGDILALSGEAEIGTFAGFHTSLSYVHYFITGGLAVLSSQGDAGIHLHRSLGFVDLIMATEYNVAGNGGNGWYHHAGLEKAFSLTDSSSLVLGTGVGYQDQFWAHGTTGSSGWSNYYATASLPVELNCRTTLTPYVGFNGGINLGGGATVSDLIGSAGGGDVLHAGVSLTVSF